MQEKTNLVPSAAELKRLQKFIIWCRENSITLEQVITPGISMSFEMAPQELQRQELELIDTPTEKTLPDPLNFYEEMRRNRGL